MICPTIDPIPIASEMFSAWRYIRARMQLAVESSASSKAAEGAPGHCLPRPISSTSQPVCQWCIGYDLRPNSNHDFRILDMLACSSGRHAFAGHISKIGDRPEQCGTHICDDAAAAAIETCRKPVRVAAPTADLHHHLSCVSIVWPLRCRVGPPSDIPH